MNLRVFVLAITASAAAFAQANATLDTPFQVKYASNLNIGDSVFNISNTGAIGAALPSGTTAATTGSICANVYTFSADEQMVSCCSCPVTPNGLKSLSAKTDLVSNTLTPAVPTSIVVKILGSAPVGGSCNNSAAAVTTATLVPGLVAWGTTLHAGVGGAYAVTETPFTPATLSAGELSRLGNLCFFILANGSQFGVCSSCRLGGLGATGK
jgi:hypothetical protein